MSRREINATESIWNHPQGVCILNAAAAGFSRPSFQDRSSFLHVTFGRCKGRRERRIQSSRFHPRRRLERRGATVGRSRSRRRPRGRSQGAGDGQPHTLNVDPRTTLLDALRDHAGLTGTKKGCGHGQCGACTVHLGAEKILSCPTFAVMAEGRDITTIEGWPQAQARCTRCNRPSSTTMRFNVAIVPALRCCRDAVRVCAGCLKSPASANDTASQRVKSVSAGLWA